MSDAAQGAVNADAKTKASFDWKRLFFMLLGLALFLIVYYCPAWPSAIDPQGKTFELTQQGKASLGLFLLAAVWWVFEVIPIGITGITIGVLQSMFLIRETRVALTDFMDTSVWFIVGSLVIGLTFTKTGLTRRLAYKMLSLIGEKTANIYLGCFAMTLALTLIMAHTAVAATLFPLLMAIYAMYTDDPNEKTNFGKGLFIGMAYVAGAGSIITLLGAARGAVALGFYKEIVHKDIGFFELSYYMAPVGIVMLFVLWGFMMVRFKPERKTIPGLKERATRLYTELGPISRREITALVIILSAIVVLGLRAFFPAMKVLDKSAIILASTVLLFVFNILTIKDFEETPWNIVLLFGGAMSIGYCLWQTGAASWLAVNWLGMFKEAPGVVFTLGIAFFVLVMTNLIMNVAAIAISLPVAFTIAPYLGVDPEVILFASLVTAGMPFLLLVGAAPNAIAYESKQFTSGEFFTTGLPASGILMVVLTLFVLVIWPLMGMSTSLPVAP